jgi:hypothetical protein
MFIIFRVKCCPQNRLIVATKYLLSDYTVVPLNMLLSFLRGFETKLEHPSAQSVSRVAYTTTFYLVTSTVALGERGNTYQWQRNSVTKHITIYVSAVFCWTLVAFQFLELFT